MMESEFCEDDFGMRKSLYTCSMLGRKRGVSLKQANVILAIKNTSSTTGSTGRGSLWSKTSFNSKLYTDDASEGENNDEMNSPGCFPIIISKQSTPKLNTSHFSVTSAL